MFVIVIILNQYLENQVKKPSYLFIKSEGVSVAVEYFLEPTVVLVVHEYIQTTTKELRYIAEHQYITKE